MLENMTPPKRKPAVVGSNAKIETGKAEYRGTILEINPTYLMVDSLQNTVVLIPWTEVKVVMVDVPTN